MPTLRYDFERQAFGVDAQRVICGYEVRIK